MIYLNKKLPLLSEDISRLLEISKETILISNEKEIIEIQNLIMQLQKREQTLSECLLIVLLGGTKVGKSTLINALAGEEISPVSSIACFTNKPRVYVHRNKEMYALIRLNDITQTELEFFYHNNQLLENLIFIDTPDFDGVYRNHKQILLHVLQRSDLAIVILTTQKYDSNDLFDILHTNVGFRRVIFLFNRIDEGIPYSNEIKEDFLKKINNISLKSPDATDEKSLSQLQVFAISARNAFLHKTTKAGYLPVGDYYNFEEFLTNKLNSILLYKISNENLIKMYDYVLNIMNKVFYYEEIENICNQATISFYSKVNELRTELNKSLVDIILNSESKIYFLRKSEIIKNYTGLFGVYLKIIIFIESFTSMINLVLAAFSNKSEITTSLANIIYNSIKDTLNQNAEKIKFLAYEIANSYPIVIKFPLDSMKDISHINEKLVINIVKRSLEDYAYVKISKTFLLHFENFIYNLLPYAVILFLVYYYLNTILNKLDPSSGIIVGGFLIFFTVLYFEALIFFKFKQKKCNYLADEITNKIHEVLSESTISNFEAMLSKLRKIVQEWKKLKFQIENKENN